MCLEDSTAYQQNSVLQFSSEGREDLRLVHLGGRDFDALRRGMIPV